MKNISILGSTGSIGTQTLEIVRNNKDIKNMKTNMRNSTEDLKYNIKDVYQITVKG